MRYNDPTPVIKSIQVLNTVVWNRYEEIEDLLSTKTYILVLYFKSLKVTQYTI